MIQFQLSGEMIQLSYMDFFLYLGHYYQEFTQIPKYVSTLCSLTIVLTHPSEHSCLPLQDINKVQQIRGCREYLVHYLYAMTDPIPVHIRYTMVQYMDHQVSNTHVRVFHAGLYITRLVHGMGRDDYPQEHGSSSNKPLAQEREGRISWGPKNCYYLPLYGTIQSTKYMIKTK